MAHVSTASHLHGYSRDTASISPLKSARPPSIAARAGELRVRPYRTDGNRRTWFFPVAGGVSRVHFRLVNKLRVRCFKDVEEATSAEVCMPPSNLHLRPGHLEDRSSSAGGLYQFVCYLTVYLAFTLQLTTHGAWLHTATTRTLMQRVPKTRFVQEP